MDNNFKELENSSKKAYENKEVQEEQKDDLSKIENYYAFIEMLFEQEPKDNERAIKSLEKYIIK